jgi:hypothetical protein
MPELVLLKALVSHALCYIRIDMALIGTVALIILIVAFRLFLPPAPGLLSLARRFGKRTTMFLASMAAALAVMAILISRR